jgi:hypothetical protein
MAMKKTSNGEGRKGKMPSPLRDEYRFDYSKGQTNRFAGQPGLGTEMAALLSEAGLKSDIPELRGQVVKPARFGLRSKKKRNRRARSS